MNHPVFTVADNYGDEFEVDARELYPGGVIVFVNGTPGVILSRKDVRRLRKALKRVLKGVDR